MLYLSPTGGKCGILYNPVLIAMPLSSPDLTDPKLRLLGLFDRREAVEYQTLLAEAGVPPRTLDRQLRSLLDQGSLYRWARGLYSRRPLEPDLNADGMALLSILRDGDADAHLTGFDVLARYAHQFAYGYTHLVYCHPPHMSGLIRELSEEEFVLLPAGRHVHLGRSVEHTVIVRAQTYDPRRYPVRDHLALPEKAWVDLLREVRRSRIGFDYGELGRILHSMERAGVPLAKLQTYARNVGYSGWVEVALGQRSAQNAEQAQLASGYAA